MLLQDLQKKNLITPPPFLPANTLYLVLMGSEAYGVSSGNSDRDVYGFCVPHKLDLFPHLRGEILGFGRQKGHFDVWQQHHVDDPETRSQYDFAVYSIIKYFSLVMENNPNMVDSLFVPQRCILHNTEVAEMVRGKRDMFLHKGCFHKFKGYSFSQCHKMKIKGHAHIEDLMKMEDDLKIPRSTTLEQAKAMAAAHPALPAYEVYRQLYEKMVAAGKRSERCKIHGFDLKFGYHVVRLLLECEQILTEGTLVLDEVGRREMMKSIRRGEWSLEQIDEFFQMKERHLEELYHKSTLPDKPDEEKIKELLLQCLEHHYGSLDACVVREDQAVRALREISDVLERNRNVLG